MVKPLVTAMLFALGATAIVDSAAAQQRGRDDPRARAERGERSGYPGGRSPYGGRDYGGGRDRDGGRDNDGGRDPNGGRDRDGGRGRDGGRDRYGGRGMPPGYGLPPPMRRGDQYEVYGKRSQGQVRSLRDIEGRILPNMPGSTYIGPEFNSSTGSYRLKFLRGGQVIWVDVDGRTGQVRGRSGY